MAVDTRDYYEVLGVPRDASTDDIRSAYRKIARRNHPDVNKEEGAAERFSEASEAHEVLRDPEKRAAYDRYGSNWRAAQQAAEAGGGFEGFGGGGGRRGGGPRGGGGFQGADYDTSQFGDIFEGLFGGRGGRRGGGFEGFEGFTMRGADQEATLELSLEEAARGGKRRITLGDGRDFEVTIPPGVVDGQRIRLAGEGQRGPGGGEAGDLFLRVHLRPHPRFRVDGRDVYTDLPVTPWEAALGSEVEVRTLDGTARVRVPPGSSSGRKLRLRGEGLGDGDLYAVVQIHVPKQLTDRERELFEQLAEVSTFDPRRPERRRTTA
jgi:curved DNA-binding protein